MSNAAGFNLQLAMLAPPPPCLPHCNAANSIKAREEEGEQAGYIAKLTCKCCVPRLEAGKGLQRFCWQLTVDNAMRIDLTCPPLPLFQFKQFSVRLMQRTLAATAIDQSERSLKMGKHIFRLKDNLKMVDKIRYDLWLKN